MSRARRTESSSTERQTNLWAPWRMQYISELSQTEGGCFLCRYARRPSRDAENLVLWRSPRTLTVLNRFPYTGGHCLIAPRRHVADLGGLRDDELREMLAVLRDAPTILGQALRAEGFNVGINLGRCAGAGLPGHLHVHVVPRWGGDTNFMAVLGDVRVIPQSLAELHDLLRRTAAKLRLPRFPRGGGRR